MVVFPVQYSRSFAGLGLNLISFLACFLALCCFHSASNAFLVRCLFAHGVLFFLPSVFCLSRFSLLPLLGLFLTHLLLFGAAPLSFVLVSPGFSLAFPTSFHLACFQRSASTRRCCLLSFVVLSVFVASVLSAHSFVGRSRFRVLPLMFLLFRSAILIPSRLCAFIVFK